MKDYTGRDKVTLEFLKCVSNHLASREDCRAVEYEVVVDENSVSMAPEFYVFPDRYHRKESDRWNVIHHVMMNHFPELFREVVEGKLLLASEGSLLPGTYQYKYFDIKNRRKWVKK